MFKRQPANKRSTPTAKGEAPPTPAEPQRVEARVVAASANMRGENRHPSREQIAIHAYHRWLSRGKPVGTDREDWIEAERQLSATV